MNWHEYYALLPHGSAGGRLERRRHLGDVRRRDRVAGRRERIVETGIDPAWLPEVQPNATPIGHILPDVADDLGLPTDLLVVTGAYDTYAASVGSAAIDPGSVSLSCGTWHSYNLAVWPGWPVDLVHDGLSVFPHPGPTGFGILSTDPNGMSVVRLGARPDRAVDRRPGHGPRPRPWPATRTRARVRRRGVHPLAASGGHARVRRHVPRRDARHDLRRPGRERCWRPSPSGSR